MACEAESARGVPSLRHAVGRSAVDVPSVSDREGAAACPGVGGPCPFGKRVASGRCPDCTLTYRRLTTRRKLDEERAARLKRIESTAPPSVAIDEVLDDERGEPCDDDDGAQPDDAGLDEDFDDAGVEAGLEEPGPDDPPESLRPARRPSFQRDIDRGLRKAPAKTASSSWWLAKDRETLRREAEARSHAMSATRTGATVNGARGLKTP